MFAMFGATILVPLLTGLDPAVALFTSGLGTIVFISLLKVKCLFIWVLPLYLLHPWLPLFLMKVDKVYRIIFPGHGWYCNCWIIICIDVYPDQGHWAWFFRKLLPPVVIGPVIITIGLGLSGAIKDYISVPADLALSLSGSELALTQTRYVLTAFITLAVVIAVYLLLKVF